MAWTVPMTFTDGHPLTAAQMNTHLRDNLLACSVAQATQVPAYFVSNGRNSIVQRVPKAARISTTETTDSLDYVDLSTVGPSVTVTTGTCALVFLACKPFNAATANAAQGMSFAVTGASDLEADDRDQVLTDGIDANQGNTFGTVDLLTTLTAGVNTFTCKYKAGSTQSSFGDRFIAVFPF